MLSKIKRISVIALAALALCLSACGESKDTNDTASQSGTEQSVSQTQETVAASDSAATESSDKETVAEADRKNSGGDQYANGESADKGDATNQKTADDGQKNGSQANDEGVYPSNGADETVTQNGGKSDSDKQTPSTDNRQSTTPDPAQPTAAASRAPEDNDNAEVNINDL